MSGANYEYCPVCDTKALYVGEEDLPPGVVIMHETCRVKETAQAAAAEREKVLDEIRQLAAAETGRARQRKISERAEEIHAEHHYGYLVPSLDSCPEHDRADYEAMVQS